jgi:hypothetical protein
MEAPGGGEAFLVDRLTYQVLVSAATRRAVIKLRQKGHTRMENTH